MLRCGFPVLRQLHLLSRVQKRVLSTGSEKVPENDTAERENTNDLQPEIILLDEAQNMQQYKKGRAKRFSIAKSQQHSTPVDPLALLNDQISLNRTSKDNSENAYDVADSINSFRPSNGSFLPAETFYEIQNKLAKAFTKSQLCDYLAKADPTKKPPVSYSRLKLSQQIMLTCWNLRDPKLSTEPAGSSEADFVVSNLIQERTFTLSDRDLFLLLSVNSFKHWLKLNIQLKVVPEESKIVATANPKLLKYLEIEMARILNRVVCIRLDFTQYNRILESQHTKQLLDIKDLQTQTSVYFQKLDKDPNNHFYNLYSLRKSSLTRVKLYMVNLLKFNPSEDKHTHLPSTTATPVAYFCDTQLPWAERQLSWVRLSSKEPADKLDNTAIFREISMSEPTPAAKGEYLTMATFGHLLLDKANGSRTFFQTEIPFVNKKLQYLPTFNDLDIVHNSRFVDNHTYFAQFKLIPSPFGSAQVEAPPPLEIWIEIQDDVPNLNTLRVIEILDENTSLVAQPSLESDLKFTTTKINYLIDLNNEKSNLNKQVGVRDWLATLKLDPKHERSRFADSVLINKNGEEIEYSLMAMNLRRELHLNYKGKLLQFSHINGGPAGGQTTEVSLLGSIDGGQPLTQEQFNELADDACEFISDLKNQPISSFK